MALTDIGIKAAEAKAKPYKLSDSEGLYLFVKKSPTSGKTGKYFRFDYKYNGKRKTLSLGTYPKISLKKARKGRDEAKELLEQGIDPSTQKKAKRQATEESETETFEHIAREWLGKNKDSWVDRHSRTVIGRLELNVFPYIGSTPIKEIEPPTLLSVLRRIEARGAYDTARRVRQICSKVFRYAIAVGKAERDPAADLQGALTQVKIKHMATITEPKRVGELLRAIDGYSGSFITLCGLKLAYLTFVRPGELRHAQWSEIDFNEALWRIPGGKMKMKGAHLVPLSRQAIAVLQELQALTGKLPGPGYLFPSERTYHRPMSENTINAALRRMGYSKEEMTGHGFRAMASTNLNEQGWKSDIIERQLAHVSKDSVRSAYNHAEYLDERKKMMQHWADYLGGLKAGGKVVPIKKQATL